MRSKHTIILLLDIFMWSLKGSSNLITGLTTQCMDYCCHSCKLHFYLRSCAEWHHYSHRRGHQVSFSFTLNIQSITNPWKFSPPKYPYIILHNLPSLSLSPCALIYCQHLSTEKGLWCFPTLISALLQFRSHHKLPSPIILIIFLPQWILHLLGIKICTLCPLSFTCWTPQVFQNLESHHPTEGFLTILQNRSNPPALL